MLHGSFTFLYFPFTNFIMIDTPPIRLVIADDHPIIREGFKFMIKKNKKSAIQIVGEAGNGNELVQLVHKHRPDVVITDIKMPEMDGVLACKQIIHKYPSMGVIALSMFEDETMVIDMFEAGARGYLVKSAPKEEVIQAIQIIQQGGSYFSKRTSEKLKKIIASSDYNPNKLSRRPSLSIQEMKIIKLICQQMTNKEIADHLKLSVRTIEDHRRIIQEKTEARNIGGIIFYALKNHLVQLEDLEPPV